jgi:hypothetical protein
MEDKLLIHNDAENNKLVDLFLLKAATEWLEKQNWISSPYGGENYLEDIIFRIKLLSGQEWQAVFQDGKWPSEGSSGENRIHEYFEMLKTIDPGIKNFCEHAVPNQNPERNRTNS